MRAFALLAFWLAVAGPVTISQFRSITKSAVPEQLLSALLDQLCEPEEYDCRRVVLNEARAWAGDINGDSMDEFIVAGSCWPVSEGDCHFLYGKDNGDWVSLVEGAWQTPWQKFEILPLARQGYRDLRVAPGLCVKWTGNRYEAYESSDYHQLAPEWFDGKKLGEAEIFWKIRYAGRDGIQFEPQWFPLDFPLRDREVELDDPALGWTWASFYKSGIYGVQEERVFLLLPRPGYIGAVKFEFKGDWLLIYSDLDLDEYLPTPSARYNRRTGELIIETEE